MYLGSKTLVIDLSFLVPMYNGKVFPSVYRGQGFPLEKKYLLTIDYSHFLYYLNPFSGKTVNLPYKVIPILVVAYDFRIRFPVTHWLVSVTAVSYWSVKWMISTPVFDWSVTSQDRQWWNKFLVMNCSDCHLFGL